MFAAGNTGLDASPLLAPYPQEWDIIRVWICERQEQKSQQQSQCRPPDSCGLYIGTPPPSSPPSCPSGCCWPHDVGRSLDAPQQHCGSMTLVDAPLQEKPSGKIFHVNAPRVNPCRGFGSSSSPGSNGTAHGSTQNVCRLESQSLPRLWHHEESPWKHGTVRHIGKVNGQTREEICIWTIKDGATSARLRVCLICVAPPPPNKEHVN